MSAIEIKKQLHQYIDLADERMAGALLAMFENYFEKEKTVAYTTKGVPLTKSQMIKEVMETVEDVEKGNYLTTEEIRAQFRKK